MNNIFLTFPFFLLAVGESMSMELLVGQTSDTIKCGECPHTYWRNNPQASIGLDEIGESWRCVMQYEFADICKYVAKERDQADFNKCHFTSPTADQISNPVEKSRYLAYLNSLHADNKFTSVHPAPKDVFAWTKYCRPENVRVVIVGQDPYPNANAHGLCFSSNKTTSSLKNIFKVLEKLDGFSRPPDIFNLRGWARQGVLLLNSMLTVRGNRDQLGVVIKGGGPTSHKNAGWEKFTDAVIKSICNNNEKVVFMFWGNYAMSKKSLLNEHTIKLKNHSVLETSHPAFPANFHGFDKSNHFAEADFFWSVNGKSPVIWSQFDRNPETEICEVKK